MAYLAVERWLYVSDADDPKRSIGKAMLCAAFAFLLYIVAGTVYGFYKSFCASVSAPVVNRACNTVLVVISASLTPVQCYERISPKKKSTRSVSPTKESLQGASYRV